jgi:hypothetical protein
MTTPVGPLVLAELSLAEVKTIHDQVEFFVLPVVSIE